MFSLPHHTFLWPQNPAPSFAGVHPVPSIDDRTSDHPLGLTGRSGILPISLDLPPSLSLSISISIFSRSHGEDGGLIWVFQKGLRLLGEDGVLDGLGLGSGILPISLKLPPSLSLSISISIFSRSHGEDGGLIWAFQKGLRLLGEDGILDGLGLGRPESEMETGEWKINKRKWLKNNILMKWRVE